MFTSAVTISFFSKFPHPVGVLGAWAEFVLQMDDLVVWRSKFIRALGYFRRESVIKEWPEQKMARESQESFRPRGCCQAHSSG
jgi:hypothetical protein